MVVVYLRFKLKINGSIINFVILQQWELLEEIFYFGWREIVLKWQVKFISDSDTDNRRVYTSKKISRRLLASTSSTILLATSYVWLLIFVLCRRQVKNIHTQLWSLEFKLLVKLIPCQWPKTTGNKIYYKCISPHRSWNLPCKSLS